MKEAPAQALTDTLETAKMQATDLLKSGRVFCYAKLQKIIADAEPLSRLAFVRRHGEKAMWHYLAFCTLNQCTNIL